MATSGTYRNFKEANGKILPHILDPRTGKPAANSVLSVSVVASDTMTADAYATTLIVLGLDEGLRFVETHDHLEAFFIARDESGKPIEKRSPGFPASVEKM